MYGGLIELKGPRRLKKQHVRRVLGQSLLHRTIRKGHLFYIGKMRTIKVSISDQKMVASKAISKSQFFVELVDCKTTLQQFILEKFSSQLRMLRYSHGSWLSLPGQVVVPATKIPSTLVETIAKKCLWSNPHIKFCAKSTLQNSDFRSIQFLHAKMAVNRSWTFAQDPQASSGASWILLDAEYFPRINMQNDIGTSCLHFSSWNKFKILAAHWRQRQWILWAMGCIMFYMISCSSSQPHSAHGSTECLHSFIASTAIQDAR